MSQMENDNNNHPAIEADKILLEIDKYLRAGQCKTIEDISLNERESKSQTYFIKTVQNQNLIQLTPHYDSVINLLADFIVYIDEQTELSIVEFPDIPDIGHDKTANLKNIIRYCVDVKNALQPLLDDAVGMNMKHQLYSRIESKRIEQGKGFYYELTDGDIDRVQELINELREQLSVSDLFTDEHRQRLLARLENLQREIHKKMGNIDALWGFVGEAGVVMGKFGADVKPLVDRMTELAKIGWRSQANAEELKSGTDNPFLDNTSSIENDN